MRLICLDFSGACGRDMLPGAGAASYCGNWKMPPEVRILPLREMQGVCGYCDEAAFRELAGMLREYGPGGIHLLDHGNYHYVSRIFTDMIREPFELVVFDHHTDTQETAFGAVLLSCGSWVRSALSHNADIRRAVLIGPPEEMVRETAADLAEGGRLLACTEEQLAGGAVPDFAPEREGGEILPVYISIDLDVLGKDAFASNWDQGRMTPGALAELVRTVCGGRRVIGADLCGGLPEEEMSGADRALNAAVYRGMIEALMPLAAGEETTGEERCQRM